MSADSQGRNLRPTSKEQFRESNAASNRPFEPAGLTAGEVELCQKQYGLNLPPRPQRPASWRHLLVQLVHFFAIMLWISGGLAILAGMPQLGYAIFIVIVLNGLFSFLQEYRAEKAGERLRDLLPPRVMVRREGKIQSIDAIELVPDDVVVLNAGDRISADMRLTNVHGLSVDTSDISIQHGISDRPSPLAALTVSIVMGCNR